ncbi:MAG TPA: cell division protein ZapA [Saprospiraceae bacterium]|nr:cell division protein ZapA [Saprospiraceae bacterium]HQW55934.1 cell division protein ZapA [Saprospiraceae bacterium]
MAAKELKQISVFIAGRSYPLKVQDNEEQVIIDIAEKVNKRIREYQETYTNREKQDWVSMALLSYAIEKHQLENMFTDTKLDQKLESLEVFLDEQLKV